METEMGSVHQLLLQHGVEQARRIATGDKNGRLCIDAAHEVLSDERGQIGIAHAGFAMAALPHKRTNEAIWERDGGQVKLLVESGLDSSKQPGATHEIFLACCGLTYDDAPSRLRGMEHVD